MSHPTDPILDGALPVNGYTFVAIEECCPEQESLSHDLRMAILDAVEATDPPDADRNSCVIVSALVNALLDLMAAAVAKGEDQWCGAQMARIVEVFEANFPGLLLGAAILAKSQQQALERLRVDKSRLN